LLAQNGVEVTGVTRGHRPDDAVSIAVLPSLSLGSLIRNMNLWSNNFMADLLLLSLGDSSSAASGRARITRWLAERPGLDPVPVVADGSGLSPRNRISAAQIVALLAWAHGQERIAPDLFASFPRPGGEGTLEKRFRGAEAIGVRGKTGTLGESGVSSIAGTVDHPTLGRFVFCILQQTPPDPGKAVPAMRAREEKWIRAFVAR
jgi:D-alanyl-D-alanine carboxypeptidase/D-alanyl-D-alanine-endopeptidase (penicillin-binding protein 4)